jgi:hypothetical protein
MADIFWSGNQVARAQEYAVTVTASAASGTLTATINSKTETYTTTSTDTAVAAQGAILAFQNSPINEFRMMTWSASGSVMSAVGPPDGRAVVVTWGSSGGTTTSGGGSPSVAATSPYNYADTANWVGGVLPASGDRAVFQGNLTSVLYGLTQNTADTVALLIEASYAGSIGLPTVNPLGFVEFLPTRLELAGTALTVNANGQSIYRVKSTAGSAVTVIFRGASGNETFDLTGTPASSVLRQSGGGIVLCPDIGETGTLATITADGNFTFRSNSGLTIGTGSFYQGQALIAGPYTTMTVDNGATVTTTAASAGTTTNAYATLVWTSTGSPGTVTVGATGSIDFSASPSTVSVTAVTVREGGTFSDPNKATTGYNMTFVGDQSKCNIKLGQNRVFAIT